MSEHYACPPAFICYSSDPAASRHKRPTHGPVHTHTILSNNPLTNRIAMASAGGDTVAERPTFVFTPMPADLALHKDKELQGLLEKW